MLTAGTPQQLGDEDSRDISVPKAPSRHRGLLQIRKKSQPPGIGLMQTQQTARKEFRSDLTGLAYSNPVSGDGNPTPVQREAVLSTGLGNTSSSNLRDQRPSTAAAGPHDCLHSGSLSIRRHRNSGMQRLMGAGPHGLTCDRLAVRGSPGAERYVLRSDAEGTPCCISKRYGTRPFPRTANPWYDASFGLVHTQRHRSRQRFFPDVGPCTEGAHCRVQQPGSTIFQDSRRCTGIESGQQV